MPPLGKNRLGRFLNKSPFVTIQRNKSAYDSVGRSLMSGAEAMLLASAPFSQRFTFLAE